ncbi:PP2C family serine/threonine-protein phosphatase [Desulfovibrio sp. JC022]|uniref:PP2C family protein-serine/threonine phosphatase n=1 Tax=Desulfovibrio sp. JC022 TaxID=2593642 RepID=UPI0013D5C490|nr:PP2C family serine/threonine-protein phosphatase [Desulfovibrio sp. JC022]NDV22610.1 serine/threonine-protein phosphatase [Desulfovibrio sp. JC022]
MKIKHTEFTHQGTRNENQDRLLCINRDENGSSCALFAVVDGMGGLSDGAETAQEVKNSLKMAYTEIMDSPNRLEELQNVLHRANIRINESKQSRRGATCSALWLEKDKYFIAHTGDTRIFSINSNKTELLTEDQNIAFTMYSMGRKTYEEYLSGGGHNRLLSFVGMGKKMKLQGFEGRTMRGDIFLLCSDGLNQFLQLKSVEELGRKALQQNDPYQYLLQHLKETVIPDRSEDNVSWICLQVT